MLQTCINPMAITFTFMMYNLTFKSKATFMKFELETMHKLTSYFDELKLLPQEAKPNLLCMAKGEFLFAEQLSIAESIHFHIKVESTAGSYEAFCLQRSKLFLNP